MDGGGSLYEKVLFETMSVKLISTVNCIKVQRKMEPCRLENHRNDDKFGFSGRKEAAVFHRKLLAAGGSADVSGVGLVCASQCEGDWGGQGGLHLQLQYGGSGGLCVCSQCGSSAAPRTVSRCPLGLHTQSELLARRSTATESR